MEEVIGLRPLNGDACTTGRLNDVGNRIAIIKIRINDVVEMLLLLLLLLLLLRFSEVI